VTAGIVVQARLDSSRFPNKVLADLHGEPMIVRQIERLRRVPGVDHVIVATTDRPVDDRLADRLAAVPGVGLFRGAEHDVLARFVAAAAAFDLDTVARVTGDCPLIDPGVVARVFAAFEAEAACDYASICRPRSYPHGFDVEIVSRRALKIAGREVIDPFDREHVLVYIFTRPERFRCINLSAPDPRWRDVRLTVDYPADLELAQAVYRALYDAKPDFDFADMKILFERQPALLELNRNVPAHECITQASDRNKPRALSGRCE
jgi:spore coat polysaccharide biosynthesis protein SpsF